MSVTTNYETETVHVDATFTMAEHQLIVHALGAQLEKLQAELPGLREWHDNANTEMERRMVESMINGNRNTAAELERTIAKIEETS